MRVAAVKISNHKRVADVKFDVRSQLVLVGPNAVGKSTILRLIDSTIGASWSSLYASIEPSQLRDATMPLEVEVRLTDLDPDDLAHFADKVQVSAGATANEVWLTARLTAVVSALDLDRVDITRSFVKPSVDDSAITRDDIRQIGWSFLPANRSPDRDLGSGRLSATRALLKGLDLKPPERAAITNSLQTLDAALLTSGSLGKLRKKLADQLSNLYPDAVKKDDLHIQLPASTVDDPLADLDVQLERDGMRAPLAAQSDGLRSMAVIALQLLTADAARVLAIDEPEIHLHPRGQANLAEILSLAPGQRAVATHAPAVLSKFLPEHVVAITAGGCRQLPVAAFAGDPKRLQHWWVESALEPLTADRVVFVEGVSDRILLRSVARLLGHDFDRRGVSVVSLGGAANFKPAIQLFGPSGFRLRLFGLVDNAEATFPAKALGVAVPDLHKHDILISTPDLEAEVVVALGVSATVGLLVASGLFTEAGILHATGAATVAALPQTDLAAHLRNHKVEAAAALDEGLTAPQATLLTVLADLAGRAVAP
ncbi:ATP-dependent nuclease [Candidatus Microthrix parvicella]|uniref:ATP-dependent nuclease n=1 Tax=Candidatus Neomicrothrix parvicella TaxID=41950 RepID=UPI000382930B|nr:AAA family ATPase [Candidatus Microthrix parvicella]